AAWSRLGRNNNHILTVTELPDERLVTGGLHGRVLVWDLTVPIPPARLRPRVPEKEPAPPEPRQDFRLGRHQDWVRTVTALPDGRAVSGGDDGRILLWDPNKRDGGPAELGHHEDWFFTVTALPDGRVVSGGKDRRLLLCDPASGCIELARLSSW